MRGAILLVIIAHMSQSCEYFCIIVGKLAIIYLPNPPRNLPVTVVSSRFIKEEPK